MRVSECGAHCLTLLEVFTPANMTNKTERDPSNNFEVQWNHREHTILLSRERVNKERKKKNSLLLSPVVISYGTLLGKPLLTSPP